MSLFMDVHTIDGGVAVKDVAAAHMADLDTQQKYGVSYLRYWVNEEQGKIFCFVEADNAEDANTVHREAHGLVADASTQSVKAVDHSRSENRSSTKTAKRVGEV